MDGYTSYGASITKDGAKQTFPCHAPKAVVADMNVIATAPAEMTAVVLDVFIFMLMWKAKADGYEKG
jgi:hypothetical protein